MNNLFYQNPILNLIRVQNPKLNCVGTIWHCSRNSKKKKIYIYFYIHNLQKKIKLHLNLIQIKETIQLTTKSNSHSNSFINMNNQPIYLMNIYLAIQICLLIVERNLWLWYQLLVFIQCYYANSGSVVFKKKFKHT